MIQRKSKIRQIDSQLKSSLRIIQRTRDIHLKQFESTIHSIMSVGDVTKLWSFISQRETSVRALCVSLGADTTDDEDAKIVAILGSPSGEQMARSVSDLARSIEAHISKWDDGRSLSFTQIEHYEATPLTIRDRTLAHGYTALCRQVEAHNELLDALLDVYHLQFWVWDGKFQYSGQPAQA